MQINYFNPRYQKIKKNEQQNIKTNISDYIKYICEDENGIIPFPNYKYNDKIIITLTSFPKRINNVKTVLESILSNSILPAKIVINLSIEEFVNKENDLPHDLQKFIYINKIIEINWVKNNTTVWKKFIPTLLKYPNAFVLCIDDDFEYPKNFIQTFFNKHIEKPNSPLVGQIYKIFKNYNQHSGCSTLDSLRYIKNYISILDREIYNLGDEDTFMTYCYKRAGIQQEYVGQTFGNNMKSISTNDSYSKLHKINVKSSWNIISSKYDNINLDHLSNNTYVLLNEMFNHENNLDKIIKIINNIQIEKHFKNHTKTYCILGVPIKESGLKIEKEMLSWLTKKYDVISIKQNMPCDLFEYPAILCAQQLSIDSKESVLYLHAKGSFNDNIFQPLIRNLWEDEFINHYDEYMTIQ